jgi:hypothetical protein
MSPVSFFISMVLWRQQSSVYLMGMATELKDRRRAADFAASALGNPFARRTLYIWFSKTTVTGPSAEILEAYASAFALLLKLPNCSVWVSAPPYAVVLKAAGFALSTAGAGADAATGAGAGGFGGALTAIGAAFGCGAGADADAGVGAGAGTGFDSCGAGTAADSERL